MREIQDRVEFLDEMQECPMRRQIEMEIKIRKNELQQLRHQCLCEKRD